MSEVMVRQGLRARLKERLSNRPDSEHQQAIIRVVIVALLALYFGLLDRYATHTPDVHYHEGLLGALSYLVVAFGIVGWILAMPGASTVRRAVAMVGDQTTLTVLLYAGGEAGAAIYPLYLWISLGYGFR